jgi:hypothetical protein
MRVKYKNGVVQFCNNFSELKNMSVVELDCSKSMIAEIPPDLVPLLDSCVLFRASDNSLTSLPPNLTLPRCRVFDVSRNRLTSLPCGLNMHLIQTFLVCSNHIKRLPENITFQNCKEFNISFNKISEFPQRASFEKCRIFNINKNNFYEIPRNICLPNCTSFRIGNNPIRSLHDNLMLSNCVEFVLYNLPIQELPKNLILSKCTQFEMYETDVSCLPESLELSHCRVVNCAHNSRLTSLGKALSLPNCEVLYIDNNRLCTLPHDLDIPNCVILNARNNVLEKLPPQINLKACQFIYLENNRLKELPESLLHCRHIKTVNIDGNYNLHLSMPFAQFLRRIRAKKDSFVWVADDPQNVHNSSIQDNFTESIQKLVSRTDLPPFSRSSLVKIVSQSTCIAPRHIPSLMQYISDDTQHSTLYVRYDEILWAVLHTVEADFEPETQRQIYDCLNLELCDSLDMCFTGRVNRLVNCLCGFSPLVNVVLSDTDFIPHIIKRSQKELGENYTLEQHKKIVEKELCERGYSSNVIADWLCGIDT